MPRKFRIGFAEMELVGLFDVEDTTFREALDESWVPGAEVTRYGRTWHLSAPHEAGPDRLGGRIGFVRESELTTVEWDPASKDFLRGEAPSGVVVPFVVDLDTRRVSFQLEAGQVRSTSFAGAFAGALNAADTAYEWRVTPLVQRVPYEEWRRRMEVVTEFRFRLERPNPHYDDREDVERLIEELRLTVGTVAGQGENIDTENPLFEEYLDHVRADYGRAVLKGRDRSGDEEEWLSDQGGSVPAIAQAEVTDEEAVEVDEEDLVDALDNVGDTSPEEARDAEEEPEA